MWVWRFGPEFKKNLRLDPFFWKKRLDNQNANGFMKFAFRSLFLAKTPCKSKRKFPFAADICHLENYIDELYTNPLHNQNANVIYAFAF